MSGSDLYGDASQFQTPAAVSQPQYDLRPLSTGEVLDRTFQVYRSRFVLFAGLALLPAAVGVVVGAIEAVLRAHQDQHVHVGTGAYYQAQAYVALLLIVAWLISIVLYGITQAATTWAVSAVYLGEPASIGAAYRVAFKHWFRYTLIVLRQAWAVIWLFFVFLIAGAIFAAFEFRNAGLKWISIGLFVCAGLSLIYGLWAYIRVSLAIPASVVESLRTSAALRRSKQLLASRKIRVFLLFLLLIALYIVVLTIQSPIMIFAERSRGVHMFVSQVLSLGIGFVASTLIGPVGAIGLCLFYFDERVRREGFDIEWMMKKVAPSGLTMSEPVVEAAPATPSSEASHSVEPAPQPIEPQQNPGEKS